MWGAGSTNFSALYRLPHLRGATKSEGSFENLTLLNKNIERHRKSTNVVEEMRKQTVQDGSRIEEYCSEKQTLYQ